MARSLDQVNTSRYMRDSKNVKIDSDSVELLTRMTIKLLTEGGALDLIRQAINESKDPAQVIGSLLTQVMGQMGEQMANELEVDPRAFLVKNGALEHVLDWIEKKLGLPQEFSDQIYSRVLEIIKAAAKAPPAPNQAMAPVAGEAQPQEATA